jgi:predicted AAA+ superfamily ATPase
MENTNIDKLFETHKRRLVEHVVLFKRYLYERIDWNNRMIAIKGARGTGKTTILMQYIKEQLPADHRTLYVTLDDLYFAGNTLIDLADIFVKNGGENLILDEVHKYPGWSRELKNVYDNHSKLKVVFTSSSVLDVYRGEADLSRRVVSYHLNELSLREYIALNSGIEIRAFTLNEILTDHANIGNEIMQKVKPIFEFNNYLKWGAYPFIFEGKEVYYQRINAVVNQILENDLQVVHNLDFHSITALKKLMYAIATSVPFKPNMSKLSERVGITRPTLSQYMLYLHNAELIKQLHTDRFGLMALAKPEKVYLNNPNLLFVIGADNANIGNLRETFFINQTNHLFTLTYSERADFMLDEKYTFEVGGKSKGQKQIQGLKNAYVLRDDIEYGHLNTLPLWMFGFLY